LRFFLLRSCLSFQKNVHSTRGFLPLKRLRFVIDCGFIGAVSVLLGRWSERPTSAENLKSSFSTAVTIILFIGSVCAIIYLKKTKKRRNRKSALILTLAEEVWSAPCSPDSWSLDQKG
jgi:cbb3-type cytochrome oxidase subunit 3